MSNTTNKEKTAEEFISTSYNGYMPISTALQELADGDMNETDCKAVIKNAFKAHQLSAHCKEKDEWVEITDHSSLPEDNFDGIYAVYAYDKIVYGCWFVAYEEGFYSFYKGDKSIEGVTHYQQLKFNTPTSITIIKQEI